LFITTCIEKQCTRSLKPFVLTTYYNGIFPVARCCVLECAKNGERGLKINLITYLGNTFTVVFRKQSWNGVQLEQILSVNRS